MSMLIWVRLFLIILFCGAPPSVITASLGSEGSSAEVGKRMKKGGENNKGYRNAEIDQFHRRQTRLEADGGFEGLKWAEKPQQVAPVEAKFIDRFRRHNSFEWPK